MAVPVSLTAKASVPFPWLPVGLPASRHGISEYSAAKSVSCSVDELMRIGIVGRYYYKAALIPP